MSANFRVLSFIPPMTQLNTPYPSTAYLTGFLRKQGVQAMQADVALGLVLKLFSPGGLDRIADEIEQQEEITERAALFLEQFGHYRATISAVIRFLQGSDSTLAHRINNRRFLPEGPRFDSLNVYVDEDGGDPLGWAFGALGAQDRARHLATLYLNDLADVIADAIDDRFEFVRYAESLAASQPSFEPLAQALGQSFTLIDDILVKLTLEEVELQQPNLVLLSVPFPGAVYAALRMAQAIKAHHPEVKIAMGGGYVNTELRELAEPKLFDFVDYITLDSGERPLLCLIEHLQGKRGAQRLVRTFSRTSEGRVQYTNWAEPDVPFSDVGTPTWDGLPLHR